MDRLRKLVVVILVLVSALANGGALEQEGPARTPETEPGPLRARGEVAAGTRTHVEKGVTAVAGPLPPIIAQPASLTHASDRIHARGVVSDPATTEPPPQPASAIVADEISSPFVRVVQRGDGKHTAIVSSTPLNYLADDGTWQPIDPRFQVVPGGFANDANVLQIRAGQRQAVLGLAYADSLIGWEPTGVILTDQDGSASDVLGVPLEGDSAAPGVVASEGRALRYAQNWSLPGLVEEIHARPGEAEQSLIFARRPAGAGQFLSLQANLYLEPGWVVKAEGAVQTGPFTTSGPVTIQADGGGAALVLAPPRAFEQGQPAVDVSGRYRFEPRRDGEWEVAVETPWGWWADPARVYPAVLDPTMQVLQPFDIVSVYNQANEKRTCDDIEFEHAGAKFPNPTEPEKNLVSAVAVGQTGQGACRILLRFKDLPTLPPGYTLDKAELIFAPIRGFYAALDNVPGGKEVWQAYGYSYYPYAEATLVAREITSLSWDPGTVSWGSYSVGTQMIDQVFVTHRSPENALKKGIEYHVPDRLTLPTELVEKWLKPPTQNGGLELRATQEGACPDNGLCDFLAFPKKGTWSSQEDLGNPYGPTLSVGSGFMLHLTYTAPQLEAGVPVHAKAPTPQGDTYWRTYHGYQVAPTPATWKVVAVKGLRTETVSGTHVLRNTGNLPLEWATETPIRVPSTGNRPNYLVLVGTGTQEVQVYPNSDSDADVDSYLVELATSHPMPKDEEVVISTEEFAFTHTFRISTTHVVTAFDLDLAPNTRVAVKLAGTFVFTEPGAVAMPVDVRGGLFAPTTSSIPRAPKQGESTDKAYFTVNEDAGGKWGLVVGHPYDVHVQYCIEPTGQPSGARQNGGSPVNSVSSTGSIIRRPRQCTPQLGAVATLVVTATVFSCPLDAIPTDRGCEYLWKPGQAGTEGHTMDVGPYRIYSIANFVSCGGLTCTVSKSGGKRYVSFIGSKDPPNWPGVPRLVVVTGGEIRFNPSAGSLSLFGPEAGTVVSLGLDPPAGWTLLPLWTGPFTSNPTLPGTHPDYGRLLPPAPIIKADLPLLDADRDGGTIKANVLAQRGEGAATVKRTVQTSAGLTSAAQFRFNWWVQAEGYPPNGGAYNLPATKLSGPTQTELAGMSVHLDDLEWSVDFCPLENGSKECQTRPGRFTNLRNQAKIAQPESLGGAWKEVQALILPPGAGLPEAGADITCLGECLDLRHATDDTILTPNREWDLPDITVSGNASTILVSQRGALTVYSTDHPNVQNALAIPFSFQTFEGKVTVEKRACPAGGGSGKVTVVTGSGKMLMPGIGTVDRMISVDDFLLCGGELYHMSLSAKVPPPGIPVGSTGLFVDGFSGTIDILPSKTELEVILFYRDSSGTVVDGQATVTLSTEGLFDMQTSGKVLVKVNYNGSAWVAWNPLDIGVNIHAWYSILDSQLKAHMWQGQGWQNKYHWLKDNDELHLSGSIRVGVVVPEGFMVSAWKLKIPPSDFNVGSVKLAFGQFCDAATVCGSYEWGGKAAITVLGFALGVFYGVDSGIHLILGSDGHVLIDQYGTAAALAPASDDGRELIPARSDGFNRFVVADPTRATLTYPLTVTQFTGSFMAGLTWAHGSPQLTLIRPDGQVITPQNADEFGVTVLEELDSRLYTVSDPMSGTWQAKISNAQASDDYHFVYFANKGLPDVTLLTPATDGTVPTNETTLPISWTVPSALPPGVELRMSLYYSMTSSPALSPTQQYGGVIRENLPLTQTAYLWDMSHLVQGTYQVLGRVHSDAPGDQPFQSRPTMTGTDQIPGDLWIEAPGQIRLLDEVPPVVPENLTFIPLQEAMKVCWDPSPERDLAGYVLGFPVPDVTGLVHLRVLRVHATVPNPPPADTPQECVRVGGLNAGQVFQATVAAYDASGNLGPFTGLANSPVVDVEGNAPTYAPAPGRLEASVEPGRVGYTVVLNWSGAPELPAGGGYLVYYGPGYPQGRGQPGTEATSGPSPIDAGAVTQFAVDGLTRGKVYHFGVQTYDGEGRFSELSNIVTVLFTDGGDEDGNGLPDDWETAHNVSDPEADPDRDCLSNSEEYEHGTDPQQADSDGDRFADGEEVVGGSDPTDREDLPTSEENLLSGLIPQPRLDLSEDRLSFAAYTQGPDPADQEIAILNVGGGVITPTATADQPWLELAIFGDGLQVHVDKGGLERGHYTGNVTVAGVPGSCTLDSPQGVGVDLWLMEGTPPPRYVYLPLVLR